MNMAPLLIYIEGEAVFSLPIPKSMIVQLFDQFSTSLQGFHEASPGQQNDRRKAVIRDRPRHHFYCLLFSFEVGM